MKNSPGNKMKLGLFVFTGLVLFIAALYFIGQKQQMFNNTFHLKGTFKDISGLQIGNNVRFSGITVGIVDDIEQISDSAVRVDMLIDEDTKKFIKKDAKAIIGSEGLMGNKIVQIIPGVNSKQVVADNDMIRTSETINIDDILGKIKTTSDNAANITTDLAVVMGNIRQGKGTVGKIFMDTTFAENVDEALVNIKQGAGSFKQNMNAASHNILLKGFFKKKRNERKEKQEEKAKEQEEKEKKKE